MQRLFVPLAGFLLGLFALAAYGQTHPNNSDPAPASTIQSTAQEVVLDMVFRDRKGKTIRDLRPEEIRISEDGVEQKLTSFRLLDGKTVRSLDATKSAESGPVPLDPTREVRLVTLVFENLDVDGKRFFRQAVKDILDMSPEPNLYFSVLTVDHKLQCIQPFTADHAALLKSLDKSSMWSFIQLLEPISRDKVRAETESLRRGATATKRRGQAARARGRFKALCSYKMAKMQYDMLQEAESADREDERARDDGCTISAGSGTVATARAQGGVVFQSIVVHLGDSQGAVPKPDQHGESRERQLLYS